MENNNNSMKKELEETVQSLLARTLQYKEVPSECVLDMIEFEMYLCDMYNAALQEEVQSLHELAIDFGCYNK